ncbi:hypothetical protein BGZ82_009897 [Podila clonocystis]|nr:hypothetical protein BGZ82_009897 [Podila clonocystis]
MSNYDPPHHPSSTSSSSPPSSVTDTLMAYLTSAMSKGQEAFEHAKDFGHKASGHLSYTAAQAQVQAQRATNYVSGRSSSSGDNDLFGSGYGHGTANRQTNCGDRSGSMSFSGLPQYRTQVEPNISQAYIDSNNYNGGSNYSNPGEQSSHHSQEMGSGDPAQKRRWSRGNSVSYSSHHYAAAHPSFKSSQGGL